MSGETINSQTMMSLYDRMKRITTFIFDVDGVLTDGSLLITEEGKLLRRMHTRDGMAIKLALQQDYRVAIMTGGKSVGVVDRLKNLGISDLYIGLDDKLPAFEEYLYTYDLKAEEICYMGDDWPDFQPLEQAGLACCPADAIEEIKAICQFQSMAIGGKGCVRELIENVLKLHEKWPTSYPPE